MAIHGKVTPKEQATLAAIGRRHFKNRENKKMNQVGPSMVIQQDQIFAEIGKLHLQVGQQAQNLSNMARAITDRDRTIADLRAQIAELTKAAQDAQQPAAAPGPRIVPSIVKLSPEDVLAMTAALESADVSDEEKEKIREALNGQLANDVAQAQEAASTKQPA